MEVMKGNLLGATIGGCMCGAIMLFGFFISLSYEKKPEKIFHSRSVSCGELMAYSFGPGECIQYSNAVDECHTYSAIIRTKRGITHFWLDSTNIHGPTPLAGDRVCLVIDGSDEQFSLEEQVK